MRAITFDCILHSTHILLAKQQQQQCNRRNKRKTRILYTHKIPIVNITLSSMSCMCAARGRRKERTGGRGNV